MDSMKGTWREGSFTGNPKRYVNPLMPNLYSGRTAPLTSKRCILYIYSTNIGTEYFKHGIYSPFFFSSKCSLFHNSNVFGSCFIHILYTGCAKIKKNNSGTKRLSKDLELSVCFPRVPLLGNMEGRSFLRAIEGGEKNSYL